MSYQQKNLLEQVCFINFVAFVIAVLTATLFVNPAIAAVVAAVPTKQVWPVVAVPSGVSTFAIGEEVVANGMPMRVTGFTSKRPPNEILADFRRILGEPVVETKGRDKRVLGRPSGNFYITVIVEPGDPGDPIQSNGTIGIVDMQAVSQGPEAHRAERIRRLEKLPPGSSIASETISDDHDQSSRYTVVLNNHSEPVNRKAVITLLTSEGYALERELRADPAALRKLPPNVTGPVTLYFKSSIENSQAMAVITRSVDKTVLIINTIAPRGSYR